MEPGAHAADVGVVRPVRDPPDQLPVDEARRHERDVVQVRAPGERIVQHELVARAAASRRVDGRPHRGRHRAEVYGDVFGLGEQLTRTR